MSKNKTTYKIRAVVFVIILAWMALGPAHRQVFGGESEVFRRWVMFKGWGLSLVDANFYEFKNGELMEIDRFEVLDYENRFKAPNKIRRIKKDEGIIFVSNELCEKFGSGADIRVKSRIATKKGWELQYEGKKNFCAAKK